MRIPRYDRKGDIDIRRVRRLLGHYVRYWRKVGEQHSWPDSPIHRAARSPAALVRKFRNDQSKTQRQRNWAARINGQASAHKVPGF